MATRQTDVHIASFEVKENPEHMPEEHVTLAFSRLAQPVLIEKLRVKDNVELTQNALDTCCRQYTVALNIVQAVEAGGVEVLAELTRHSDDTVRERATRALKLLLINPTGRQRVIKSGVLVTFMDVFDDKLVDVRRNMFSGLVGLSAVAEGTLAEVEAGYVKALVRKAATDEDDVVQELALVVLAKCVDAPENKGLLAALEGGAMGVCIDLLDHGSAGVREQAGKVIGMLAVSEEGKKQAIDGGAVRPLNSISGDLSQPARAAAAGALMMIVVDNAGKEALLAEGMGGLVQFLKDDGMLVKLNSMKAVAAVAAHPKAREQLLELGAVTLLKRIRDEGNVALERSARTAIAACEWEP